MTFSKRILIQWLPEPASEPTSTYVLHTPGDHFVDIRILETHYPYPKSEDKFNEVFDWVSSGKEQAFEGTNQIQFNLEIDSMEIGEAIETGKPLEECRHKPDSGFFHAIPDSEDRKETGCMTNPATGVPQDYIEIWRSLDAEEHSPSKEVRESTSGTKPSRINTLTIDSESYEGKLVLVGNWAQGMLHEKKTHNIHVVRAWFDGQKWEKLIDYGHDLFPLDFKGKKDDIISKESLTWVCIE
ncbi:protein Hri1p [[Candida] anglica]|uniref:Protein HRI1 n=1 Tax=[Candida] anglica TaxID=148631 RepID=A0ABP0E9N0_9ASCO